MPRLDRYKNAPRNKARYNAKSIARAKLYESGYNQRLANVALAPRGFRPFTSKTLEKKVYDMGDRLGAVGDTFYQTNVSNTGTVFPIFIPGQGADYNQRIGRKVTVKSLYIKWRAFPSYQTDPTLLTTGAPELHGRILVVHDAQPNGVLPAFTDIIQVETTTGFADTISFVNMNNRDRFRIIMDKMHQFPAYFLSGKTLLGDGNGSTWVGKKFKRLNLEVIFNASSTNAIADISSGALYVCVLGSELVATAEYNLAFDINTRIRYTDT